MFGAHQAKRGGEVDGAYGFVQAVVSFDEVLAPHGDAVIRKALAELKKAALAGASGLVAKFVVANLGEMNEFRQLLRDLVAIEFLEGE